MKKCVLAFSLVLTLLSTAGALAAEPAKATAPISSTALRAAFAENQTAAEQRYLGQTVVVTGVVLSTGMSVDLTPNVVLSDKENGPVQVICVLPRADTPKLSGFKAGQKVAMKGRVYRLSERGVVLKECVAVE